MKRKLAFVLKGYPRVSETFIAQEIYLLEQKGYEIEIFSMRKAREPERQPIVAKIKAPVTYIPEYIFKQPGAIFKQNLKVLLQTPVGYLYWLIAALLKSIKVGKRDPIKRFLQGAWLVGFHSLLKKDYHFHSHFIHAPTEMTRYMSRLTGQTYSISAHAKDIYTIPKKEVINRINDSEFLTTCTRFNYEFLNNLQGIQKDKVYLSYHGIDTETFKPSEHHCLGCKTLHLASVGRLVEKKGYDIIFESLKILKDKNISFHYDIYGQGELKDFVQDKAKELDLQDQIKFHFTATHPQIIERFQQKKGVFLCGSKITASGDRDGIPNTVAEAMSMELPVIATKVSGIPELIRDQDSGYLIPSEDPQAMAKAIEDLVKNPDKAEKISKQGRERVKEFFDAKTLIGEIDKLLKPCVH